MENLTGQGTDLKNQATNAVGGAQTAATNAAGAAQTAATNAAGAAQTAATNAVGNASSAVANATSGVTSAVGDIQSKIPQPPEIPQLPKLPPVPQIPGVPEFKQKELPIPKKFKNSKFKDKLAAAADKAKQLAAKGQAAVAGAQAKAQAAVASAQDKIQSTVASAQEKAQKAVSDAQEKVKQGVASAEEKATAIAEDAKKDATESIKKAQEENGGKPLTEEEKDKITINKTTEAAEKASAPTQQAAKAAIEKTNQNIGKPDLSERIKFLKSYKTPKVGNTFYLYQERDSVGVYYVSVHDTQSAFSYKIYNVAKQNATEALDAAIKYMNEEEDDV